MRVQVLEFHEADNPHGVSVADHDHQPDGSGGCLPLRVHYNWHETVWRQASGRATTVLWAMYIRGIVF